MLEWKPLLLWPFFPSFGSQARLPLERMREKKGFCQPEGVASGDVGRESS